eukprot:COSAG01_NODE_2286_length_7990_cov_5.551895_3_plen_49_part_00
MCHSSYEVVIMKGLACLRCNRTISHVVNYYSLLSMVNPPTSDSCAAAS